MGMNDGTSNEARTIEQSALHNKENLHSYIEELTQEVQHSREGTLIRKIEEDWLALYSLVRDTSQAQTIGEALEYLCYRPVEPEIIDQWLDGIAESPVLAAAVCLGYPEFIGLLARLREEHEREFNKEK